MALFKVTKADMRVGRDWSEIEVMGFKASTYATGKTYYTCPEWFKLTSVVAAFAVSLAVFVLSRQATDRDECVDYGTQMQQEVKYSGKSGCYYRESALHQWKRVQL